MPKYWVIAPYDSTKKEIWDKVWKFDQDKQVIAVGWSELGDISLLSEEKLKSTMKSTYKDINQGQFTFSFNVLWNFYHSIEIGDVIIARRGTKKIAAIGRVNKTAFYNEKWGKESTGYADDYFYPNFIGVEWDKNLWDIQFDKIVFSFQTMYEINEEKYNTLLEGKIPQEQEELKEFEEVEEKKEFVLEKYLEEFIVSNFDVIFNKKLRLYRDEEGNIAQQFITDVGTIDLLALDNKTGDYVVIELKKGKESDKVVGQILRYMGWIEEYMIKDDQKVRGIIICGKPDQKLLYAIKRVNDIEIKTYEIDFKLVDQG